MDTQTVLNMLKGADRRSIGRPNRVVAFVRRHPSLFPIMIDGLRHADELVRMRAADAAEKLTRAHPEWLLPFECRLIN